MVYISFKRKTINNNIQTTNNLSVKGSLVKGTPEASPESLSGEVLIYRSKCIKEYLFCTGGVTS